MTGASCINQLVNLNHLAKYLHELKCCISSAFKFLKYLSFIIITNAFKII